MAPGPGLVRDAQKRDGVIGLFLQFKKKGDKPKWNDISAQGAEFKACWAQWENLVTGKEGSTAVQRVGGVRKSLEDAGCVATEFGECRIGDDS